MAAKTLRIIRPNAKKAEPLLITLPVLNQVQFIQFQEDENVPCPAGFEEVSSYQSVIVCGSDSEDSGISEENDMEHYLPVRKRQRLDNLTLEEKIARRKMKNRVAAQTARDKKKAKMDELEDIVRGLQKKNKELENENKRLLAANQKLLEENTRLMEIQMNQIKVETCPKKVKQSPSVALPVESAALINDPQQKGQGKSLEGTTPNILILHLLLALLAVMSKKARQMEEERRMQLSLSSPIAGYRLYLMMAATVYYSSLCRALKNRRKPPDPLTAPLPS